MIEAGLYIHVPFCETKCAYCAFCSIIKQNNLIEKYVFEAQKELNNVLLLYSDARFRTVYIGGGTPSLLTPEQIQFILSCATDRIQSDAEITMEVNPNSAHRLQDYKAIGINRLSVGVQSTDDRVLQKLGRLHHADDALKTLHEAAGVFGNVSADLIIGVDEDQDVNRDFEKIKPYIKHLSAYMLSVEDSTPLYRQIVNNSVSIATEDAVLRQYNELLANAEESGFMRYETSNFAQPGFESKHNSAYWNLTPYIGIGPSAHSYVYGRRYYNTDDVYAYLQGKHSGNRQEKTERMSSVDEDKTEFVMLSLRTTHGIDKYKYNERFGTDVSTDYATGIKKAEAYLHEDEASIRILPQFFLLQNSVINQVLFGD